MGGAGPGSTGRPLSRRRRPRRISERSTGPGHRVSTTPREGPERMTGRRQPDVGRRRGEGREAAEDRACSRCRRATRFIEALPLNPSGKPGKTRKRERGGRRGRPCRRSRTRASRADVLIRASSLPQFLARELKNCSFMNTTTGPRTRRDANRQGARRVAVRRLFAHRRRRRARVRPRQNRGRRRAGEDSSSPSVRSRGAGRRRRRAFLPRNPRIQRRSDQTPPATGSSPVMAKPGGVRSSVASSLLNVAEKEERRRAGSRRLSRRRLRSRAILDAAESVSAAAHAGVRVRASGAGAARRGLHAGQGKVRARGRRAAAAAARGDDDAAAEEEAYQSALRPFTYDSAGFAGHAVRGVRGWTSDPVRTYPESRRRLPKLVSQAAESGSAFVRVDDA